MAHSMLRAILQYCVTNDKLPPAEVVRTAINDELNKFRDEAAERGLDIANQEWQQAEIERQCCLTEGAVRAWVKVRLPFILENFKIVQVEEEFEVPLSDDIIVMLRLDGVLQRRSDGEYSALEFKTTSVTDDAYFESWRYATQTLLHLLAIQKQFGKPGVSVMMEFLSLGTKRNDKTSGQDIYYSPLVRGFVKYGAPPLEPEKEFGWDSELARKKNWMCFNVWTGDNIHEDKPSWMSASEYWVEHVLPLDVLKDQLYTREIFRNPDELDEMVANTIAQQRRIYQGVQLAGSASPDVMAQFFPGNMDESCFSNKWRKQCPMLPLCYKEIEGDPLESGKFQRREPHHDSEFEV